MGKKEEEEEGGQECASAASVSWRTAIQHPTELLSTIPLPTRDDEDAAMYQAEIEDDGMEEMELTAEDAAALQMFMPTATTQRQTLGDIIMEKIKEKERIAAMTAEEREACQKPRLDPKITAVYTQLGHFLKHYTSGKTPKCFKIIPSLRNWEEILWLTNPLSWSPAALFIGTRMFASNCKPKIAQRFYNMVLLPRFQDDVEQNNKLNYHIYQALKKAIYRPSAFFKGIVLPLAESCSLREAIIMASVLTKCSIPVLHSSVALLKLTEMEYSGTTTLFMKTLLNKKYALPLRVLQAIVNYFYGFVEDDRKLPVMWHQNVLIFVQRYKNDISVEQRDKLKVLLRAHQHHQITPEIRRELFDGAAGGKQSQRASADGQPAFSNTMMME